MNDQNHQLFWLVQTRYSRLVHQPLWLVEPVCQNSYQLRVREQGPFWPVGNWWWSGLSTSSSTLPTQWSPVLSSGSSPVPWPGICNHRGSLPEFALQSQLCAEARQQHTSLIARTVRLMMSTVLRIASTIPAISSLLMFVEGWRE